MKKAKSTKIMPRQLNTRKRVQTFNTEPSMTKQSFTEECNINNIIKKFQNTGQITHLNPHTPQYGYAPVNDFRESMEIVLLANQQFQELPSNIRRRFGNSAEQFLEFAQNPENHSQLVEMGLATKRQPPASEKQQKPATSTSEAQEAKADPANTSKPPE